MRSLLLVAGLLLSGTSPAATEDDPRRTELARVRTQLASGDDVQMAWGAWTAGEQAFQGALPDLLAALEAARAGARETRYLLDAIIRLGGVPEGGTLVRLLDAHPVEATILLCRAPPEHAPWRLRALERFEGGGSRPWLALGNVLAAERARGFAAHLMSQVRIRLHARVWDTTGPHPVFRQPRGWVPGEGAQRRVPGLPPAVRYALGLGGGGISFLIAPGPHPVYAYRVADERVVRFGVTGTGLMRGACQIAWLQALAALPTAPLSTEAVFDLRWTGRQPFIRELTRHQRSLQAPYWRLARRLAARGLLTEAEGARLPMPIELEVIDHRAAPRRALPAVPAFATLNPWRARAGGPRTRRPR